MEYLITLLIENFRLFCCIANSLEDSCLSRIGAANDEDAKTWGKPSNVLCSYPLSCYILCILEFDIGKRHLSLRWWKSWRTAVGSASFGYARSATGVTSLTQLYSLDSDGISNIRTSLAPQLSFTSLNPLTTIVKARRFFARSDH